VIENMSSGVFGSGGGEDAARLICAEFLGTVELDVRIRMGSDSS
jgi:hypothetical protein